MVTTLSQQKVLLLTTLNQHSETSQVCETNAKNSHYLPKTPTLTSFVLFNEVRKATDKELRTLIRFLSDKLVSLSLSTFVREESVFSNSHKSRLKIGGDNFQNYLYGFLPECFKRTLRSEFKFISGFTTFLTTFGEKSMNEDLICEICLKPRIGVNHVACGIKCEVCEERFTRSKLVTLSLGNDLGPNDRINLLCCEQCSLVQQVSFYRIQYEKTKGVLNNALSRVNMFKSVMLKADTMAVLADESISDVPSIQDIRERLSGIETWTIDQMQYWLETHEKYARVIAENLGKKATAEELKAHLKDKTKKALEEQAKRTKEQKDKEKTTKVTLSKEDKALDKVLSAYMKIPGITREQAKVMYQKQLDSMKGATEK